MSRYPHPEATLVRAYRAEVRIDPAMTEWMWLDTLTLDDAPFFEPLGPLTLRTRSVRVHASTAMFYRCLPRSGYPVGALDSEARYEPHARLALVDDLGYTWGIWRRIPARLRRRAAVAAGHPIAAGRHDPLRGGRAGPGRRAVTSDRPVDANPIEECRSVLGDP